VRLSAAPADTFEQDMAERRQHPRLGNRFDGNWTGASTRSHCQVADLSLAGCYVNSLVAPAPRETTVVTVNLGAHSIALRGEVVYVEAGMGFAVKFHDLAPDDLKQLHELVASLLSAPAVG
jgi:hypothetical protein